MNLLGPDDPSEAPVLTPSAQDRLEATPELLIALQHTVEKSHQCRATFRAAVFVREDVDGHVMWEGDLYVFDIAEHPTATTAYAWADSNPDGEQRLHTMLREGPVQCPRDAVRTGFFGGYQALRAAARSAAKSDARSRSPIGPA